MKCQNNSNSTITRFVLQLGINEPSCPTKERHGAKIFPMEMSLNVKPGKTDLKNSIHYQMLCFQIDGSLQNVEHIVRTAVNGNGSGVGPGKLHCLSYQTCLLIALNNRNCNAYQLCRMATTCLWHRDVFSTDTFSTGHFFDGTLFRRDIFSTFPDSIAFYLKWHFN